MASLEAREQCTCNGLALGIVEFIEAGASMRDGHMSRLGVSMRSTCYDAVRHCLLEPLVQGYEPEVSSNAISFKLLKVHHLCFPQEQFAYC